MFTGKRYVVSLVLLLMIVFGLNAGFAAGLSSPMFDQPLLITAIGQSADGQMVRVLAQRGGLNFSYNPTAASLENAKTLILVVGGSSKGLGAAGINPAQEEQRAQSLISAAKDAGVKIIVMHVGGESRRGELTDRFIRLVAPAADYMIVVADGNQDNIFGNAASDTPIDMPESVGQAAGYLKNAFK